MYSKLFRKYLYPGYETFIRKRKTLKYYQEYCESQYLSRDELQSLQWHKLKRLLDHCYQEIPYYRRLWKELDIHPHDITNKKLFEQLPVLTKDVIRQYYDDMLIKDNRDDVILKSTSGTTGEPIHFAISHDSYQRRIAMKMRGYSWAGSLIGDKTVLLWAHPYARLRQSMLSHFKDVLYYRFFNYKLFDSLLMDNSSMDRYVKEFNRYKPKALIAYVSPLYELARHIKENNLLVHEPKTIIVGAEPLYPAQRELIEQVFNARLFNTYGCREVMLIAAECSEQHNLHISSDHLVVETVDDEYLVTPNHGHLALTDLHNFAMPLVRYINGDLITLSDESCGCSRNLPLIKQIDGRVMDCIRTVDGRVIPGIAFSHFFKYIRGLRQFQVKQSQLDQVQVYMVKDSSFSNCDFLQVDSQLKEILGLETKIEFSYVENIPMTASGKRQLVISEL